MDSYVLTLFDENGNPIPIPAIQGVGIKDIRREGEVLEIELDDGRVFAFGGLSAELPEHTEADEGKFMRIINGTPVWSTVINGEGVRF